MEIKERKIYDFYISNDFCGCTWDEKIVSVRQGDIVKIELKKECNFPHNKIVGKIVSITRCSTCSANYTTYKILLDISERYNGKQIEILLDEIIDIEIKEGN